jgi:hypothetical protein
MSTDDEMRAEYDLRGGVRGKYYERYPEGTNIVRLDPEPIADSETACHPEPPMPQRG